MERYAKGFRSFGGFLILLNIGSFFLPLTQRAQEGYAALRWSQFHYVKAALSKSLPYVEENAVPATNAQLALIFGCMALPLLLSLAAGLWGIFGGPRQRGSSALTFVALILYAALGASLSRLWPQAQPGQTYQAGVSAMASVIISGCSAVAAILAIASTPKKIKKTKKKIPQVQEIKQQQAEARYSIIDQDAKREPQKECAPGNPRGVMVGLTGIYAGAQIPMPDGEYIALGRQNDNQLIFEGQAKVSRNHCKIKWDASGGKYIICDYSSAGSFLNGSRDCLPQNLELTLEPGSVVAIGDEANTFRLE